MSEDAKTLRSWILDHMANRDWNQSDLARAINVHPSRISQWVNGRDMPSVENCYLLAEVFRADPAEVLELAGHPSYDRDLLADIDPRVRFYFMNYKRLPENLQRLLLRQLEAYYAELEEIEQREGPNEAGS